MYACMAENDGELSFEPNQIITNGKINMGNVNLCTKSDKIFLTKYIYI